MKCPSPEVSPVLREYSWKKTHIEKKIETTSKSSFKSKISVYRIDRPFQDEEEKLPKIEK